MSNESAQANDLRKGFVAGKAAYDLALPRFGALPRQNRLELCEFFLDPFQARFELSRGLRHDVIVRL